MTKSEAIGHLKNIAIYSVQDGYTDEARQALDMAIKVLEEPGWKNGHWILMKNGNARCSECGRIQLSAWDMDNQDNFCHHCGSYNGG